MKAIRTLLTISIFLLPTILLGKKLRNSSNANIKTILPEEYSVLNDSPIIGIMTSPEENNPDVQYIEKRYVNFVETSGGRVVPILYNSTKDEIRAIFKKINGILFPGGGTTEWNPNITFGDPNMNPFFNTMKYIVDFAIEANDNGDYFPIFGICRGMDIMLIISSNDTHLLQGTPHDETWNYLANLHFLKRDSRLFSYLNTDLIKILENEKITPNTHHNSVFLTSFLKHPHVHNFYSLISISYDRFGKNPYVSAIEAKKYPFYGIQFHMEKSSFLFRTVYQTVHNLDSQLINQGISNFFLDECRKSGHSFENYRVASIHDIHNYPLIFMKEFSFIITQ